MRTRRRPVFAPGARWFVPSFHGDLRLEADVTNVEHTVLKIVKPTPREVGIVNAIGAAGVEKGWLDRWDVFLATAGGEDVSFTLKAPIDTVGAVVLKHMAPGPDVLTAMKLRDGGWDIVAGNDPPTEEPAAASEAPTPKSKPGRPKKAEAAPEVEAAATVKRPTPCCPQCEPGAIAPASEVLLSFLDEEQHRSWAMSRTIVVNGSISGFRYQLAHRHSPTSAKVGRICYALDHECVVHFHDHTVPPEEEVLAALLILKFREPWLCNEATMLGVKRHSDYVFKNPFGDIMDGRPDAIFMERIGEAFLGLA